jgi:pimeloyl-ACP methyl ester carboxylesterase/DNA-binding CsgD family transcriptional regulator
MSKAQSAAGFLKELMSAGLRGQPLFVFADNQDGFAAALADEPDALEAWLQTMTASASGTIAEVRSSAFASLALAPWGRIVVADARVDRWNLDPHVLAGLVAEVDQTGAPAVGIVDDGGGLPMAVAVGSAVQARRWPLRREVRSALDSGAADHALIAFSPEARDWLTAARAYGLTPAETRLVSALARTQDLQAACSDLGISYQTGRKTVASAMRKTGAARQPELLRQTLAVTAGSLRPLEETDGLFADLFGLRPRQARLARLIARGLTRDQAAAALGLSGAAAKDDLSAVFAACAVSSALGLARVFAEVEALHGLARACDVTVHRGLASPDPVRLVPRRDRRGVIALADHGPVGARPVIVFHTTTGGRAQSPTLLAALRRGGFRAVVVERPGFGLTDPSGPDIWQGAAEDLSDVLDELEIGSAVILARGGARPALAAAARSPDRIRGGVMLGPDTPAHLDRSTGGVVGQTKLWMFRRPGVIGNLANLMSNLTGTDAIARLMRASVERSAVDQAVLELPGELDALVRGGRQCAMGRTGFALESEAWASGREIVPPVPGHRWQILFGSDDTLFSAQDGADWWHEQMPDVTFKLVEGAGRFCASTHPQTVVQALDQVWAG